MISKHILLITFLNKHELIFLTQFHLFLQIVYSIWPIDKILSSATIPGQRGSGSNGSERGLNIPQSSQNGASRSDGLMTYPRNYIASFLLL